MTGPLFATQDDPSLRVSLEITTIDDAFTNVIRQTWIADSMSDTTSDACDDINRLATVTFADGRVVYDSRDAVDPTVND